MTSEALKALAERVEGATGPSSDLDHDIHAWMVAAVGTPMERDSYWGPLSRRPPYSSSIDGALGLVERVLPGWSKDIYIADNGSAVKLASPLPRSVEHWGTSRTTAPLAILAALLRALLAKGE